MKNFYRVEKDRCNINSFQGEAGYGIYATPNMNVLDYYKIHADKFRILKFTPKKDAVIINLDSMREVLIIHIKCEISELSQRNPHYICQHVSNNNYHRFPWAIMSFVRIFNCSGYVIQHKHPTLPTGKQIVILKKDDFDIIELKNKYQYAL